MLNICWLGMSLDVPDVWEIVRHSVKPKRGQLVLVDRRRQRMQLSWQELTRVPDMDQMVEDYRKRDLEKNLGTRHKMIPLRNGWRGLRRALADQHLTRLVRFDIAAKRLVELVLIWPDGPETKLEETILDSYALKTPKDGEYWRAFGMGLHSPARWRLLKLEVQAGKTEWTFVQGKGKTEAVVTRLGAAESWLRKNPQEYLEAVLKQDLQTVAARQVNGHGGAEAAGWEAGPRWRVLTGIRRKRKDLAWVCEKSDALFQVTVLHPPRADTAGEFQVECC